MAKQVFRIPVAYEMMGNIDVYCETLEEAEAFVLSGDCGLPRDPSYVTASLDLDTEHSDYGEVVDKLPQEADNYNL